MVKIGYARTSKDDQDIVGQVRQLLKAGVSEDQIFCDTGESGAKKPEDRPGFKKLIKFIDVGTTDTLYVTEYSRIGRDTKSSLEWIINIEKKGIRIIPLSERDTIVTDVDPSLQPLMITALALANELERKHTRERTLYGLEKARAKGVKLGRPVKEIDFKKIEKIKEEFDVSENAARKYCGYKASTFYRKKKEMKENV